MGQSSFLDPVGIGVDGELLDQTQGGYDSVGKKVAGLNR